MLKMLKISIFISVLLCFLGTLALAQKAPDYKISNIKIIPFDSTTGEFEKEIMPTDDRSFFNELDISLLATIEISGKGGSYDGARKVQITVTEGKKVKMTKTSWVGILSQNGKFYIPVWLYPAMCDEVKITAKLIGQKTASTITRKIPFLCGE